MLNKIIQSSIYLQSIRLYGRLTHSFGSNVTVRQYCHVRHQRKNNSSSEVNELSKYPGYKVVYRFPYIKYASLLSRLKLNQTIITGICVPASIVLQTLNIVSQNDCLAISCTCLLLTFWTHFTFFICNNLIGLVYFKQDDQKVILSYLNYWGKRTDLTTSLQNIVPLTDTPVNVANRLYRKLDIVTCKEKLKISIPYGRITEKTHFEIIFGSV